MDATYTLVYSGELQNNTSPEDAAAQFSAITKIPAEKAREILVAGKPKVLTRGLSKDQAKKYQEKFQAIGMDIRVKKVFNEASPGETTQDQRAKTTLDKPPETPAQSTDTPVASAPKNQSTAANPYAAPAARLDQQTKTSTGFLAEPRKVSAGHGWQWITGGFRLFLDAPMKWMGMIFVFYLLLIPISLIPIAGNLLNMLLGMVFTGGLMIGAHSLKEKNGLRFSHLFSGFTQNLNQLLLVGLFYLLGFILVFIIAFLPVSGTMLPFILSGGVEDPAALQAMSTPLFLVSVLLAFTLIIPLFMAIWLAPSLVAITGKKGFAALKLSLKASLRNILPQMVYGLGFILLGLLVAAIMGILIAAITPTFGNGGSFVLIFVPIAVTLFVGLPTMAITLLSAYAAFRDLFCSVR